MYEVKIKEHFSKVPVFTLGDVNQIISNRVYAKKLISKEAREGKIKKIKKGLYTFYEDPFLISTFLLKPSYISSISALSYHHKISQIPNEIFCFTSKLPKTYFFVTKINFFHTKYFFGFKLEKYSNFKIPIATPEKAIIDSIGKVPLSIIEEAFEDLDMNRMLSYLKRIGKSGIIKRIGYLLEKNGYEVYEELKKYINSKYIPLDPLRKGKKKRIKKWRLKI